MERDQSRQEIVASTIRKLLNIVTIYCFETFHHRGTEGNIFYPVGPSPRRPAAPAHSAARVAPATQAGDDDRMKRLCPSGNILNIYVCICLLYGYAIYVRCLAEAEAFVFVGISRQTQKYRSSLWPLCLCGEMNLLDP